MHVCTQVPTLQIEMTPDVLACQPRIIHAQAFLFSQMMSNVFAGFANWTPVGLEQETRS